MPSKMFRGSSAVKGLIVLFAAICFFASAQTASAGAVEKTWDAGAGTSDWNTAANWNLDTLPATGNNVTVPVTAHNPVITSASLFNPLNTTINASASLTIGSGGSLTTTNLDGAGSFSMTGGTFYLSHDYHPTTPANFDASAGGTVNFTGSGGGNAFKNVGTYKFNNVIISGGECKFNNAANTITIASDLSISGGTASFAGTSNTANSLHLGGTVTSSGTWGSTGSSAAHKNNTYFTAAATGYVTIATAGTVTLTYSAGANGSLTGSTTQVVVLGGSGTAVTAVADSGYHFVDWSDASTANPRTDTNVSGNVTVTANFASTTSTKHHSTGDRTAPTDSSVQINSGAASTESTAVTLNLVATDATFMTISNSPIYNADTWEPYTTSKAWTLESGLGVKTVWVQYRDDAYNLSAAVDDTIELVAVGQGQGSSTSTVTTTPTGQGQQPTGGATCPTLAAGNMVKVTGKPAIYYLNSKLEVMYFPSGDEFKSWRPTYGGYLSIDQACFDSLKVPAGYPAAVNFRPGSYLVKRSSSDQLYTVMPGNTLAKISSSIANSLYGASAYTGGVGAKVMTVSDVYWPHYVNRAADITTVTANPGMLVKVSGTTYYVDADSKLREVTASGFIANGFQERFVRAVPASAIAGFETGETITAEVASITDKAQGI